MSSESAVQAVVACAAVAAVAAVAAGVAVAARMYSTHLACQDATVKQKNEPSAEPSAEPSYDRAVRRAALLNRVNGRRAQVGFTD